MHTVSHVCAHSPMGLALSKAELTWLIIFTVEAALKVIAFGFLLSEHTYLRSGEHKYKLASVFAEDVEHVSWILLISTGCIG